MRGCVFVCWKSIRRKTKDKKKPNIYQRKLLINPFHLVINIYYIDR